MVRRPEEEFDEDIVEKKFSDKFIKFMIGLGYPSNLIEIKKEGNKQWSLRLNEAYYMIRKYFWYNKTKNLQLQTLANVEEKIEGWWPKTKADFLIGFIDETRFYCVPTKSLYESTLMWLPKHKIHKGGFIVEYEITPMNMLKDVGWYEIQND